MLSKTKSRLLGMSLIHSLLFFLLTTQFCFAQWVQVGLNDEVIKDIAVQNQNIFAVTADTCIDEEFPLSSPCHGKLYRSTNNGLNWTILVDSNVVDVAISTSGKIFKIERDSVYSNERLCRNLYYSLDNGNNWIWSDIKWQLFIDSLLFYTEPERIILSPDGVIYCNSVAVGSPDDQYATDGKMAEFFDLIARSTDDGLTWTSHGPSVIGGEQLHFNDNLVLTIGYHWVAMSIFPPASYIYVSSDYGNTWNYVGSLVNGDNPSTHFLSLYSNDYVFAEASTGDDHTLYLSTDTCNTWALISTLSIQSGISWLNGSSEGMLIGTEDLGVFVFSDEGDSLGSKNEGLTSLNIHTLSLDNNGYVYAGTENGVWRRPLSEIVTSVEQEIIQPTEFILEQNYPNPFNSSTVISYQLPVSSEVTLKIFDVLGNEIVTLVDEYKPAGRYEIEFNAEKLSSGVYFYQLCVGDFINSKKMILLK